MRNKYSIFFSFLTLFFLFHCSSYAQVVINEYSASNVNTFYDNYSENPDWIELYNLGTASVDLTGWFLSDDPNAANKWQFPSGVTISAGGFLKIWASGRDEVLSGNIHTNFKFTQTEQPPESVVLSDPTGVVVDMRVLSLTQAGHSNGRATNGAVTWSIFTAPTPGTSNNNSTPYQRYTNTPSVDLTAGFYSGSQTLTVTNNEPNSQLRYTLDGTEPIASSAIVSVPITITATKILKVRSFSNDPTILPGLIEFNTYLIDENTTLPVMSFAGNNLITLLNGNASIFPVGSMEYFSRDKVRTTFSYGEFDKHGQDSWVHPQRSLDCRSRDDFGYNNALYEQFFKSSDRTEFQRLIIRACGDDNYPGIDSSAHIRDDFVESLSLSSGQNLDVRKSERCILFANGQYWGVYSIREKVDDADYCEYYYGQDRYNLQFILLWGNIWAEYGGQTAIDDYYNFYNYIMSHDMSIPENYTYVTDQYDITSLADYMIINSYVVCSDWLNWNVGWWRGLDPNGLHKKWGYILWDEDATFGHYINYTGIPEQSPYVTPCFQESLNNGYSDPGGHVDVLLKLRENDQFNQYYINRYIDLLNTTFKPDYSVPYLDSMVSVIEPEMPRHFTRWGGNSLEWQHNVQKIRDFITIRYGVVNEGLIGCYNLTGPYNIMLDVEPAGKGKITINSISPDTYPWNGSYFGNIDIKLFGEEIDPQYEFDHWEIQNHPVNPNDTNLVFLNLTMDDQVTAVFTLKQDIDTLVINEINYNSSIAFDPGDWVELYNPQSYALDASGWIFKDNDDLHSYSIPIGTIIPAKGYIVLAVDDVLFEAGFPDVDNHVGPVGFGFSGTGEFLRLYNSNNMLIDSVFYDDALPWPIEPDGNGPTLELINPLLDNALAESWSASCSNYGTPGAINCIYSDILEKPIIETLKTSIIPNPMMTEAYFIIDTNDNIREGELMICDFTGREVQHYKTFGKQSKIIRQGLQSGFYVYRYFGNDGRVSGSGKMVIK
jgi:hypothetical protein